MYRDKSLYNKYVGADDGHADLARYIIRNGKKATETFIKDPSNPLIIEFAKEMRTEYTPIDHFKADGNFYPDF
jgi:hypothetical protein